MVNKKSQRSKKGATKKKHKSRGVTLLEVLAVIAIIAILAAAVIATFMAQRAKARDRVRQSDARTLQDGFEQYYYDQSQQYPGNPQTTAPIVGYISDLSSALSNYLTTLPKDPLYPNQSYKFAVSAKGPKKSSHYVIAVKLERNDSLMAGDNGSNEGWWELTDNSEITSNWSIDFDTQPTPTPTPTPTAVEPDLSPTPTPTSELPDLTPTPTPTPTQAI